jgi:hypothetical protein
MPMADDSDPDFGFGEDFADIDDFDDDEDEDGERGAAVVMHKRVKTLGLRFTFVDSVGEAMRLAERCGVDGCVGGEHAVAFRDAAGRIRIRPGPSTNVAVPQLTAAMSARLRDPRTEKRRQQRIQANARRQQRRLAAKQQEDNDADS